MDYRKMEDHIPVDELHYLRDWVVSGGVRGGTG